MKNVFSQEDFIQWCGFVQNWMRNNPDKARKSIGHGKEVVHAPTLRDDHLTYVTMGTVFDRTE